MDRSAKKFKKSDFLRRLYKRCNLRIDRNITPASLEGQPENYVIDTIFKKTLYNINDLSLIIKHAYNENIKEIILPDHFLILADTSPYNYAPTKFEGALKGISVLLKHTGIKVRFENATPLTEEILEILQPGGCIL